MEDIIERPYHHGDLRRAIIDTTMDMLTEDGNWQFTLREVARRAGVSHAAPYRHFSDKTALLVEIALIGFDGLRNALRAVQAEAEGDLATEFLAMATAYLRFGRANPALYRLMFGGELANTGDLHLNPARWAPSTL
jgi:AcrR family transcriptional regulator